MIKKLASLFWVIVFLSKAFCCSAEDFIYTSPTLKPPPKSNPPRPWAFAAIQNLPPSEPGKDYTPSVVPNGSTLAYKVVDGVKVLHMVAEPINWEVSKGLVINTWGYNGSAPGPLIEVGEGDRVRIYVTNRLPAQTTIHWHGVLLPCGMDGVSAITQPGIKPGETYVYEFIFPNSGTFMYHSHHDSMTQEGLGLVGMIVVHERQKDLKKRPERDFVILLHEWAIEAGTSKPDPNKMGFNVLTMNGKAMPGTEPLVAKLGDRVRKLIPGYMAMGTKGMHDMAGTKMPLPEDSIPMFGFTGQFGRTVMGGDG